MRRHRNQIIFQMGPEHLDARFEFFLLILRCLNLGFENSVLLLETVDTSFEHGHIVEKLDLEND